MWQVVLLIAWSGFVMGDNGYGGEAKFSFASYFGSYMVLQKAPRQAVVWGYHPNITGSVSVYIDKDEVANVDVRVNDHGEGGLWFAKLPPTQTGESHRISAVSGKARITLSSVLFGDVWICTGQENMHFPLRMEANGTKEITDAGNYSDVRIFMVGKNISTEKQYDLAYVEERWTTPKKYSVGGKDYFSAVCWLFGKYLYDHLKHPIGLISSTAEGSKIEAWSSPETVRECSRGKSPIKKEYSNPAIYRKQQKNGPQLEISPLHNSEIYNTMIHPLFNLSVYGIIWYQGEANSDYPATYSCLFQSLIKDWRNKFFDGSRGSTNPALPFGFVQLAPNRNNSYIDTGFPDIRWHQTAEFGTVPNPKMRSVFMAVAIDLPDFLSPYGSFLPRYKQDVAARLVISCRVVAYGDHILEYTGPTPLKIQNHNATESITIQFDSPIEVRQQQGFEACCSSGKTCEGDADWRLTRIQNVTAAAVEVSYKGRCDRNIVSVRYAWRESPCPFKQCAIYGVMNGLPAAPFVRQLSVGGV